MKVCMRARISKCSSTHTLQSISFLYIKVLWSVWLVKLSRFQYYLDYNHTFDLFYNIEVYSCKALYSYFSKLLAIIWLKSTFQHTSQSFVYKALSTKLCLLKTSSITHIVLSIMSWRQRLSHYFFYYNMLESYYNFWNLLSTWLFLLTNMINMTSNNSDSMSTTNLNICVNSTDNNSCDYFLFDISLMLSYMNSQLIYYFIFSTIFAAE